VLHTPQLQYKGERVRIDELKDQEIIIKDFIELPNRLSDRTNSTYLVIAAEVIESSGNRPVTFNTSSWTIKEMLMKAKSKLPVRATVRHIKTAGPWGHWTLE
jgi:hypothetical protein